MLNRSIGVLLCDIALATAPHFLHRSQRTTQRLRGTFAGPPLDALIWAITIAAWEVRTIRKRYIRSRSTSIDADEQASPTHDPERAAVDRELLEAAQEVLGSLSEDDRATLAATLAEETPAGVSGIAFRKRRERAMARLKQAWRRIHGD